MDNKKLFFGLAVLIILSGAIQGYFSIQSSKEFSKQLGANLTYSSAVSRLETFNLLEDIIEDYYKVASSTGHGLASSTDWNPGNIVWSPNGSSTVATTTQTISGAVVGDYVMTSFATTTSANQWTIDGKISAADTVLVTLRPLAASSTAFFNLDLGTATLRSRVFRLGLETFSGATTTAANR